MRLLDAADQIHLFNTQLVEGVLRHHAVSEQRLFHWRRKFRDVFIELKERANTWVGLTPFVLRQSPSIWSENMCRPPDELVAIRLWTAAEFDKLQKYMVGLTHVLYELHHASVKHALTVDVKSRARKGPDVGKVTATPVYTSWSASQLRMHSSDESGALKQVDGEIAAHQQETEAELQLELAGTKKVKAPAKPRTKKTSGARNGKFTFIAPAS